MSKYLYCTFIFIYLTWAILASDSLVDALDTISDIYKKVESLQISWRGYTLGAKLSSSQKQIAKAHLIPPTASESNSLSFKTYKFKDNGLIIVADVETDRVLIVYELFEDAVQQKVRDVLGSLIIVFKEPTLFAHDKIVYWAYGENGKYSSSQFEEAKDNFNSKQEAKSKQESFSIIATVKLQSEISIMETGERSEGKSKSSGNVYYIISSEPILKKQKK